MGPTFNIEAEEVGCPPYMRGMIFHRVLNKVWVVENCQPLEGKLQLGCYRLPESVMEKGEDGTV